MTFKIGDMCIVINNDNEYILNTGKYYISSGEIGIITETEHFEVDNKILYVTCIKKVPKRSAARPIYFLINPNKIILL